MITEDYCGFETAKLLKEKEFKGQGEHFYEDNKITNYINYWSRITPEQRYEAIEAPTLQMAMKWLREAHKLHIAILWDCGAYTGKNSFCYHIDRMDNYEDKGYNKIGFDSYEEACEAAIKYCLENLI